MIDRVKVVRGDVRDQAVLERVLGEYEIDTVFHLAAQTIVGIANRNPVSTFESQHPGDLGPAGSLPPQSRRSSRSSSPPRTRPTATRSTSPTTRTLRSRAGTPTTSASPARDLIAQTYAAHLRPAGGDHALRQLLRRRRPELEPDRPRHDPLGPPRPAAGDPLRRAVHPRLLLRRGRRGAPTSLLAERLAADPELAGEAFNFSNEIQVTVLDLVRAHPATLWTRPGARMCATRRPTRSATSTSAPPRRSDCWTGRRCSPSTRPGGDDRLVQGVPRA